MLRSWKVVSIEPGDSWEFGEVQDLREVKAKCLLCFFCSQGDRGFDGQLGPKGDQGEKGERVSQGQDHGKLRRACSLGVSSSFKIFITDPIPSLFRDPQELWAFQVLGAMMVLVVPQGHLVVLVPKALKDFRVRK